MIRIEGPRGADPLKKTEKAKKSGGTSGAFGSLLADDTGSAGQAAPMSAPGGIGNLLSVQYDEDPAEKRSRGRMQERTAKVLDTLDVIQRGLVTGGVSVGDMNAIKASVTANREKINDPRLLAIMDEVDLRAQVELAKLEVSYEKQRKN